MARAPYRQLDSLASRYDSLDSIGAVAPYRKLDNLATRYDSADCIGGLEDTAQDVTNRFNAIGKKLDTVLKSPEYIGIVAGLSAIPVLGHAAGAVITAGIGVLRLGLAVAGPILKLAAKVINLGGKVVGYFDDLVTTKKERAKREALLRDRGLSEISEFLAAVIASAYLGDENSKKALAALQLLFNEKAELLTRSLAQAGAETKRGKTGQRAVYAALAKLSRDGSLVDTQAMIIMAKTWAWKIINDQSPVKAATLLGVWPLALQKLLSTAKPDYAFKFARSPKYAYLAKNLDFTAPKPLELKVEARTRYGAPGSGTRIVRPVKTPATISVEGVQLNDVRALSSTVAKKAAERDGVNIEKTTPSLLGSLVTYDGRVQRGSYTPVSSGGEYGWFISPTGGTSPGRFKPAK